MVERERAGEHLEASLLGLAALWRGVEARRDPPTSPDGAAQLGPVHGAFLRLARLEQQRLTRAELKTDKVQEAVEVGLQGETPISHGRRGRDNLPIARPMALSFRLGKIPIRILPSFFIMTVLLGLNVTDLRIVVAWVFVVFVSVALHELGHAGMGLAFGLEPNIELHGMGGMTSWTTPRQLSTAQRVAISLAGPCARFVVAAIARRGLGSRVFPPTPLRPVLYPEPLSVNFSCGIMQLLPTPALD